MEVDNREIEILNDLLKINNDRVEGYLKAAEDVDDAELKKAFKGLADISNGMAVALVRKIYLLGGDADVEGTSNRGRIYRWWIEVRGSFTGKDDASVLKSCEMGEVATQDAYAFALENLYSDNLEALIDAQKKRLEECHDLIKRKGKNLKGNIKVRK